MPDRPGGLVVGLRTWELSKGGTPAGGIVAADSPEEAAALVLAALT